VEVVCVFVYMKKELVSIDGSQGEGGGQIVRTSLTLACLTGRSVRIENIRAGRSRPGLANQHLTCARAAGMITSGTLEGDHKGSPYLQFSPGEITGGDYRFDIGSAGAASLVLQTVLPALFFASQPSTVTVTGGTHNPWAPPFDFLERTFLPRLKEFGFVGDLELIKPGFYPAGGGRLQIEIQPADKHNLKMIDRIQPKDIKEVNALVYTLKLPAKVYQLQRKLLLESSLPIENLRHVEIPNAEGSGNCVMTEIIADDHTTIFTAFGQRGKHSSKVIKELVEITQPFLNSPAGVDRYLADQLLLYMALSGAGRFTTNQIYNHCRTNISVIQAFLPVEFKMEEISNAFKISCASREPNQ